MAVRFQIDKGGSTKATPKTTTAKNVTKSNAIKTAKSNVTNTAKRNPTKTSTPSAIKGVPRNATQDGTTYEPIKGVPRDALRDGTTYNPVSIEPEVQSEAEPAYSVYNDPFYMQQLQQAQSAFNTDRTNAQASMDFQNIGTNRQLAERPATAEDSRRRLAGNFASRGMGGGRAGALSREEAEMNARELTSRTGLREQMAELNRQFTSNFGAAGTDWLGTSRGASAQQGAINTALQNRLAGLTTVGQ